MASGVQLAGKFVGFCVPLKSHSVLSCVTHKLYCSTSPELEVQKDHVAEDGKMLAWQIHSYGGLEELQLSKSARIPSIKSPNDVLVQVAASSVNPIDIAMLGGYGRVLLNAARQAEACSLTSTIEFPLVLGRDFCGHVVSTGHGVGQKLKVGDVVWGAVPPYQQGCHAQHVLINKCFVKNKPTNLSTTEAASMLYTAITAWSALKYSGDLCITPARGKRVLVLGASGGVGTVAVQMLKAWGAHVVGTCRGDAMALVESLGADVVIDYLQPDANKSVRAEGKYDIILDAAGLGPDAGPRYADCLRDWSLSKYVTLTSPLLRNADQLGIVGGIARSAMDLLAPNVQTGLASALSSVRWAFFMPTEDAVRGVTDLVQKGQIVPILEKVYNFAELPAAYERVQGGHLRGKVVINMDSTDQKQ